MAEDMKINFLVFSLKYKTYVALQIAIIASLIALAPVAYIYGHESADWLMSNSWWLCLVIAALEVGEAVVAITLAKRRHNAGSA